jgi:hypothetical protein
LIDRAIRYLWVFLAGMLVFLVGILFGTVGEDASHGQAPTAPQAALEPPKGDFSPVDLPTRRVRSVPVRPDDVAPTGLN